MLVVLDSTVLIDYLRGRPLVERVRDLRRRGDIPATTSINVEEVVRGLREPEVESVRLLFNGLVVLPIDQSGAWQAGSWRREFSARGITLFQADCLIAASAHQHGPGCAPATRRTFLCPSCRSSTGQWAADRRAESAGNGGDFTREICALPGIYRG